MYGKSKKVEKDFDINEFDNMLDSSLKGLEDNEDIADPDLLVKKKPLFFSIN